MVREYRNEREAWRQERKERKRRMREVEEMKQEIDSLHQRGSH